MFMKIANARKNNNKGFSLIELIIVIAIMVALIAVMAPQFIKYVQSSRDAALQTAAEDFLAAVKVAYADPDHAYASVGTITILVKDKKLDISGESGKFAKDPTVTELITAAGTANGTAMGATTDKYTITIGGSASEGFTFSMEKGTTATT